MDGIETARQIRKIVGPDVTIILLSAYDWSGYEKEANEAGIDDFIQKPLLKSRLAYTMKKFLSGNRPETKNVTEPVVDFRCPQGQARFDR